MKLEIGEWEKADEHGKPRIIVVIPARGGSARLPDKNMRMFAGRPLVAWSVIQAVNSLTVDEVWVSSDSDRILDCAEKHGAKSFLRPDVEDDDAPGYVPMLQLIQKIAKPDDVFVGMLPTSPLRKPDDIDKAVKKWFDSPEHGDKMLMTVARIHEDFRLKLVNDDYVIPLPPSENNNCRFDGSLHISTRATYEHDMEVHGENVYFIPYLIEEWQALDINTANQLRFAEMIFYDRILSEGLNPYEVYRKGGLKL